MRNIYNPTLPYGFQKVNDDPIPPEPMPTNYIPEYADVSQVPGTVDYFCYTGPTIEGYTHGYFYERHEVTPAVVDVETYTIPASGPYIDVFQDINGTKKGRYYLIEDYKYLAEMRAKYNRLNFFVGNTKETTDGKNYQTGPYALVEVGDCAYCKDDKTNHTVVALSSNYPDYPRWIDLSNGVRITDYGSSGGSTQTMDAFVNSDGDIIFWSTAMQTLLSNKLVEVPEAVPFKTPGLYAIPNIFSTDYFEHRYLQEAQTITVTTVITPAVDEWQQTDTQPRDQQKTKLSEFTDDLGDEPAHTHKQYSTHDETIKSINDIIMMNEDWFSYGIEFDTTVSSPTCTRIGNMALHRDCPIQNNMRGCLLDDNGKVLKYLNPQDWRGEVRDGSQGQVMGEIPSYYAKFETVGTKRRVRLSEYALKGYFKIPVRYVSAYEAALERSTGKLASVVNLTEDYRGGDNTAAWDGTYRSLLGRPATVMSRTAYRNAAKARNTSIDNWTCYLYQVNRELYWLFAVEYATLNSQADYTAQRTPEGYRKGGLGQGVDNWNWDVWNAYNNANPFVNCGYTDEFGNATGVKNYTALKADGTAQYISPVPRYHGIENPFGHIWKWSDGINIRINPGDGLSECFVADDPSVFSDSGYTGYTYIGNEARTDGYIKDIIFGEHGEIMPTAVGGSSTTYYCDYHHTNIPSATQLRGLLLGGAAHNGASCGFVHSTSFNVPSSTWTNVGSRLCFITKEQ